MEKVVKGLSLADFEETRKKISPYIMHTPLVYSQALSRETGANVYLKLDCMQVPGSFKVRGAASKLLSLSDEEKKRGVTAFSTGNHGGGVAYVAQKLGIKATICMSENVPESKLRRIASYGADIDNKYKDQDEAELACYKLRDEKGVVIVPPFDDKYVILGQGSIGLEIAEDLPDVDEVVVPVSGGGIMSGILLATRMKTGRDVKFTGVSMEKSAVMYESIQAGHPIEMAEEETYADSLLGGIGVDNRYTFYIIKNYVNHLEKVSENEIGKAVAYAAENQRIIIEGGASVGIAYALRGGKFKPGSNVVLVVTGCNLMMEQFLEIMKKYGSTKQ